ncbi:MAG: DUF3034 family protein [Betaproteobacteria bacterium]
MTFTKFRSLLAALGLAFAVPAFAGDHLIATGGVSEIEGSAGGGIVPWAVIAGYGTRDQLSITAYHTNLAIDDFHLKSSGVAVGIHDRVELSLSRQLFGLGSTVPGQSIRQDVVGIKLKLAGDLVVDQDSFMPQFSAGIQYKKNRDMAIPTALGARKDSGVDFYVSATKLYLAGLAGRNVLANLTVRATKANQLGILGFGGDKHDGYQLQAEASLAVLLRDNLAVGAEYRYKPDNLNVFREDNFYDLFVAWFPTKNVSLTLAHAVLGQVADKRDQKGTYFSVQLAY